MKQEFNRKDDKLIIETKEFSGKKYLDVRSFYHKDGQFLPGKAGITFKTKEEFEFLIKTLTDATKEIEEWLSQKK